MRALVAGGTLIASAVGLLFGGGGAPPAAAAPHGVEVTSAQDLGAAGGAVCPHESLCTLRRAIEVANGDALGDTFTISFSPTVFPAGAAVEIPVGNTPLPNVSRADVLIDGSGAGVALVGAPSSLSVVVTGLTVTGDRFALRNVQVHRFTGNCLVVTGAFAEIGAPGGGNVFGGCATGVSAAGANARIAGNLIGFTPTGTADQVATGIVVAAGGASVGGPATAPGAGNTIGFADTAIVVGGGTAAEFSGVTIERNSIGRRPSGDPAPVGNGVILSQPSKSTAVTGNAIRNAKRGIVVAGNASGLPVTGNRFASNTFQAITDMAIDLGADGLRNPNDPGDVDSGPNMLMNHPVITRATQSRVTGIACGGCNVQVYLAAHEPGGMRDYGTTPLAGAVVTADAAGQFVVENPAAAAGNWILAIATDDDGNTSEFGPSARVGSGAVLCGNVQLLTGWNHVAYFGGEPVALSSSFAPDPTGAITAIYRTVDGTGDWQRWFSTTAIGRSLEIVEPGESYWMYASAPVTLPGGFSISFPVPVQLQAGVNDLVYLGAPAHVLDAFASLGTLFHGLYRYDAVAASWLRFGDPSVPAWAQDFTTLEACTAYQVELAAPAALIPLQP